MSSRNYRKAKTTKDTENTKNLSGLPENWSWVKLGDVFILTMGQSPPSSTYNEDGKGLPFFQGKSEFTDLHPIPKKWCSKPKKIAEKNDILISVRAPVGTTNIADQKCCIGRGLAAVRYPDCPKYLFYFFRSIEKELDSLGTGTTFKAISASTLKNLEVTLPPLPEQHRIVEKIEELFSELDNGIENLKKSKEQIKTYRQAVLKAAFEGRLTSEDRSQKSEVGSETANVKSENGELPEGWEKVKFKDFVKIQRGYDLPLKNIVDGKYPVITSSGIKGYHNEFKANGPILVTGRSGSVGSTHFHEFEKYWPHNTVLFVKDFCGNHPKFIYYFFLQFNFRSFSASTAVPTLDRKQLYNEDVYRPKINQQTKIVEEIEKRFSVADKMEEAIDESLKKSEALRQSILKQAFEGKLV